MTETTDGRSRQLRIADSLRGRIRSGEFPPGAKLPALPGLAEFYGASLVTVRLALGRLRQEGLVESRQGVGNFVRKAPPVRRYGIARYGRSVWGGQAPRPLLIAEAGEQGRTAGQETEIEKAPAPALVAGRLPGVAEGDLVYVRRRTTTIDGIINQSADSYFTIATGARSRTSSPAREQAATSRGSTPSRPYSRSRRRSPPACPPARKQPAWRSPRARPCSRSSGPTTPRTARWMSQDS